MKKLLVLIAIIISPLLRAQIYPVMNATDTLGCIVISERGRENFKFADLTIEQEEHISRAYPGIQFLQVAGEQEALLKNMMKPSSPVQRASSDNIENHRAIVLKNDQAKHLFLAGEDVQLAMVSSLLSTTSGVASYLTGKREFYYLSVGLGIISIYYHWTTGSELKKAGSEIVQRSN